MERSHGVSSAYGLRVGSENHAGRCRSEVLRCVAQQVSPAHTSNARIPAPCTHAVHVHVWIILHDSSSALKNTRMRVFVLLGAQFCGTVCKAPSTQRACTYTKRTPPRTSASSASWRISVLNRRECPMNVMAPPSSACCTAVARLAASASDGDRGFSIRTLAPFPSRCLATSTCWRGKDQ